MKKSISLFMASAISVTLFTSQVALASTNKSTQFAKVNPNPIVSNAVNIDNGGPGEVLLQVQTAHRDVPAHRFGDSGAVSGPVSAGARESVSKLNLGWKGKYAFITAVTTTACSFINSLGNDPYHIDVITYEFQRADGSKYVRSLTAFYDINGHYLGTSVHEENE
jgi:hypothetical protein